MTDIANLEVELKLRLLDPAIKNSLFETPSLAGLIKDEIATERLEAWYYDTGDHLLQKEGIAFRIRFEQGEWLATIKSGGTSAGGLHKRKEWNIPVSGPLPDLSELQDANGGELLQKIIGDDPLVPLFCTAFERQKTAIATDEGDIIEIAIDSGEIVAGGRQEQISEVELELKTGNPLAVLNLGARLAAEMPLDIESRSKYYRGLCLAELAKSKKQPETPLVDDLSADAQATAKQMVISQIHSVFSTQEQFLLNSSDPEALHQFRIQLRKLRSFVSFAKPLLVPKDCDEWQEKLRDCSRSMNELRELDVIIETWQDITSGEKGLQLSPPPWLGMFLQNEREKTAEELLSLFDRGQLTPVLLELWVWFEKAAFTEECDELSAIDFLVQRISVWFDSMRQITQDFSPGDLAALHQLRIHGKKMRYVLEAMPLKDRKTKLVAARLKKLQDSLGDIRDTKLMADALDKLMLTHASRVIHRDAGILLGWSARSDRKAKDSFERNWRRFRRAARRWLRYQEK